MLLCPSAQWGFGVSNVIFPPTWKAEEHVRKQFMSCESSWTDLLCPCPACLTHLPAHTTTLHLVLASVPPLHTEINKKQQPVLLYSCQTVNSSTNTGQKNTHYFILPSETHKMNFLSKKMNYLSFALQLTAFSTPSLSIPTKGHLCYFQVLFPKPFACLRSCRAVTDHCWTHTQPTPPAAHLHSVSPGSLF